MAIHLGQFCYSYDKMYKQIFHNKNIISERFHLNGHTTGRHGPYSPQI